MTSAILKILYSNIDSRLLSIYSFRKLIKKDNIPASQETYDYE